MMTEQNRILVAAFYQFADLATVFEDMREPLRSLMQDKGVFGSILLAPEGVNGTIAGPAEGVNAVLASLRSQPQLSGLEHKESWCSDMPFQRSKVRLKKEIITFRKEEANPNLQVGTYVEAEDWNDLITQPDIALLDTRNDYEVEVGTFKGAIDPNIEQFTDFAKFVDENMDPAKTPRVAMFCTGGIRCEKASAYMLAKGFKEVYHLKGGILKYLEKVPVAQSQWEGGCFVFDEREAIGHGLTPSKK